MFVTETKCQVEAITETQMIEVDLVAMEETGPNLFQMMENAGRNMATFISQYGNGLQEKAKVPIFAGTGGNGGGGICAGRNLANHGVDVSLCLTHSGSLSEVLAWQLNIFRHSGGKIISEYETRENKWDIVVDAVIGYSLRGAPRGKVASFIEIINSLKVNTVSLDNPSGLDVTSGSHPGAVVRANATLTLLFPNQA